MQTTKARQSPYDIMIEAVECTSKNGKHIRHIRDFGCSFILAFLCKLTEVTKYALRKIYTETCLKLC